MEHEPAHGAQAQDCQCCAAVLLQLHEVLALWTPCGHHQELLAALQESERTAWDSQLGFVSLYQALFSCLLPELLLGLSWHSQQALGRLKHLQEPLGRVQDLPWVMQQAGAQLRGDLLHQVGVNCWAS